MIVNAYMIAALVPLVASYAQMPYNYAPAAALPAGAPAAGYLPPPTSYPSPIAPPVPIPSTATGNSDVLASLIHSTTDGDSIIILGDRMKLRDDLLRNVPDVQLLADIDAYQSDVQRSAGDASDANDLLKADMKLAADLAKGADAATIEEDEKLYLMNLLRVNVDKILQSTIEEHLANPNSTEDPEVTKAKLNEKVVGSLSSTLGTLTIQTQNKLKEYYRAHTDVVDKMITDIAGEKLNAVIVQLAQKHNIAVPTGLTSGLPPLSSAGLTTAAA